VLGPNEPAVSARPRGIASRAAVRGSLLWAAALTAVAGVASLGIAPSAAAPTVPYPVLFQTSSHTAFRPAPSPNLVVWQDQRNGNWDVYGYDVRAGQERQFTQGPCDHVSPSVSAHVVMWLARCPDASAPGASTSSVEGYDLDQQTTIELDPGPDDISVHVSWPYVVWLSSYSPGCRGDPRCKGSTGDPHAVNLQTGQSWTLGRTGYVPGILITGSYAIWLDIDDGWTVYDLASDQQVVLAGAAFESTGDGWLLARPAGQYSNTIAIYNPPTGAPTPIAEISQSPEKDTVLADFEYVPTAGLLVWEQEALATLRLPESVWAEDLHDQQVAQISPAGTVARDARVAGGVLAWDTPAAVGPPAGNSDVVISCLALTC